MAGVSHRFPFPLPLLPLPLLPPDESSRRKAAVHAEGLGHKLGCCKHRPHWCLPVGQSFSDCLGQVPNWYKEQRDAPARLCVATPAESTWWCLFTIFFFGGGCCFLVSKGCIRSPCEEFPPGAGDVAETGASPPMLEDKFVICVRLIQQGSSTSFFHHSVSSRMSWRERSQGRAGSNRDCAGVPAAMCAL